ncbi:MAG: SRPBCC family protein [Solirubrobacteraceae bacterium]
MTTHRLERRQHLDHPLATVFAFFAQARNLERITPSWLSFRLVGDDPIEMGAGTLIHYRLRIHHVPLRWTSRIEEWEPDRGFVDRQLRGPYRLWRHRHCFEATDTGTLVVDQVDYALPLGRVGDLAHPLFVGRDLDRIFDFRQRMVPRLLG